LVGVKEGAVEQVGFRLGAKNIPDALFKEIEARSKKIRKQGKKIRVVITHCDNPEDAKKLKQLLKEIDAEVPFINLTSPVVGAHVGPGSVIAAWAEIF
jgi:fatty acid-binding protein DegV